MDSRQTVEIASDSPVVVRDGRLQRLLPVVRSLTGKVKALGVVSAASAVVVWGVWFDPHTWLQDFSASWAAFSGLILLMLLIPSGAAYVGYRTLNSVLDLPGKLREVTAETTTLTKEALESRGRPRHIRIFAFFRAIWAARSLVLDSRDTWGKAVAAVKLARLASLPFVVALLGTFALNFAVIALAAGAVAFSLIF
ncbi:MAG: hypothetical protein R3284_11095 [Rubricoccaceae bacterium]|nr:hypothetical protein [Rubricoccaceae bacterium]